MANNKKNGTALQNKKPDAYDIVLRIGLALMAVAVFPVIFFMQLIEVKISLSLIDVGMDLSDVQLSIFKIIRIAQGKDDLSGIINIQKIKGMGWPAELDTIKGRLIFMAVLLAIVVIAAVFVLVWSIVSNKKRGYLIGSGAGLAGVIAMMITFSSIAGEFISGNIDVLSLFTKSGILSMVKTLLGGSIINVDKMLLGNFAIVLLMLFIGMVLWIGIFAITEIGSDSAPQKKSKSKAKAKK